jgi:hypothetical protein
MGSDVKPFRDIVVDGEKMRVKNIDVSEMTKRDQIDWKREAARNRDIIPVQQNTGALPGGPRGVIQVQGEIITAEENRQRNRPRDIMAHVRDVGSATGRGRFPDGFDKRTNTFTPRHGRNVVMHGFPEFDKDGNIVRRPMA